MNENDWIKVVFDELQERKDEHSNKIEINTMRLKVWLEKIYAFLNKTEETEQKTIEKLTKQYEELCVFIYKTSPGADVPTIKNAAKRIIQKLPYFKKQMYHEAKRAYKEDPSAKELSEVLLSYPSLKATLFYRIAHELYIQDIKLLARIITEISHEQTGIDIHPGAVIGDGFFIDHGTGVVIGETCVIGNNVTLYHGVTIGVLQFQRDEQGELVRGTKRHPTIEDNVTIYAEAMVLGGATIVGEGSIIGSNAMVTKSIPPNSKIIHKANV